MTSVVDTNVILVANGQHTEVGPDCVTTCTLRLQKIMAKERIALDDMWKILGEYQNKTQPKTANRPGDAFVKWALRNNANNERCDLVPITPDNQRGYQEFPADARLADFDAPDRKFVAVASRHPGQPTILQAADSKWLRWAPALRSHGITVDFLCPSDIKRFQQNKEKS